MRVHLPQTLSCLPDHLTSSCLSFKLSLKTENIFQITDVIIAYDAKDDGSQFNRLLPNRLCNTIDNHNQISLPNRFWQP